MNLVSIDYNRDARNALIESLTHTPGLTNIKWFPWCDQWHAAIFAEVAPDWWLHGWVTETQFIWRLLRPSPTVKACEDPRASMPAFNVVDHNQIQNEDASPLILAACIMEELKKVGDGV